MKHKIIYLWRKYFAYNYGTYKDRVFEISKHTSYKEKDILDFMTLSGSNIDHAEIILERFFSSGISNLRDVNTLIKLGYFNHRAWK